VFTSSPPKGGSVVAMTKMKKILKNETTDSSLKTFNIVKFFNLPESLLNPGLEKTSSAHHSVTKYT